VKVEAADLSQLTIQDGEVVPVRVIGVALFIKFEEAEGKSEMALEAASEAHMGCGYNANATALEPAMHARSTSTGLGSAHFRALAGVGTGQRVSTACKCLKKLSLWLMIKTTSSALFFCHSPHSHIWRQRRLVHQALCA
jgi:hypothetical protein